MIKKTMILTAILFTLCSNLQAQDLTRPDLTRTDVIKLIAIATKPLDLTGAQLEGANFNKLNLKSIIRAKGNFYSKTEKIEEHGTHSDYEFTHKGFILYINTNNGFTRLKNGEKINSIENRGLFFNPGLEHNSSSCTDQHGRININFNYF